MRSNYHLLCFTHVGHPQKVPSGMAFGVPKWCPNRLKSDLGDLLGSKVTKTGICDEFWTPLGDPLGTLWDHFGPPEAHFEGSFFEHRFFFDFGSFLDPPWATKSKRFA